MGLSPRASCHELLATSSRSQRPLSLSMTTSHVAASSGNPSAIPRRSTLAGSSHRHSSLDFLPSTPVPPSRPKLPLSLHAWPSNWYFVLTTDQLRLHVV
ncbi:hypothetical protein CDD80_2917 [Ophiocordyceps camponoti-rufipedis]|uniref:Uncharacterized protein n=1 Tax=Ophiocordyceps camponoti-rufipedis TaxID=2004952 RepID=A0A2C5ZDU5_9HYPO|nr:hypothetical protein CDD80_2917 [Ophiocordyceps camponoti-rufipedis]